MTPAQFRTDFTEFASATAWPDSGVQFYITLATKLLRPERWLDILPEGIELFVAHNLTLEGPRNADGSAATPTVGVGVVASKQIGKVSVSYDNSTAVDPTAGHWNLTTYGMRFLQLMRMAGTGGLQLGVGCSPGPYPNVYGFGPYGQ